MEETVELRILNGEAVLQKGQREMLTYKDSSLIPADISEDEEGYTLIFHVNELTNAEAIRNENKERQFQFLLNCAELRKLYERYNFSMDFSNIYYDYNLMPKILKRDIQKSNNHDFLAQYKALVAAVLTSKYSFEDYFQGGKDLYIKNKSIRKYAEKDTVEEIYELLKESYEKERKNNKEKKTLVRKSEILRYRIEMPLFAVITLASVFLLFYMYFIEKEYNDCVIAANEAYLSEDYFDVANSLAPIKVDRMSVYSKYILARSYIISESLTNSQKENVMSGITLKTEETVLNYWIYVGRLEFEAAIEQAQRLGDNDLLLYAYIKYRAYISDDLTMNGEKKAELITQLDSDIERMEKQMNSDRTEVK